MKRSSKSALTDLGINSLIGKQLEIPFDEVVVTTPQESNPAEKFGTFQDSLRAPIHRWFKYPAGFSYKLVEAFIKDYSLDSNSWLLDPFAGCGTTAITAKQNGINSLGIEAHPFVNWVARTKCFWEYNMKQIRQEIQSFILYLQSIPCFQGRESLNEFPELIFKCYSEYNLWILKFIRDTIPEFASSEEVRNFFNLALTDSLRTASKAGTGWPYIAPTKYHEKSEQPALKVFTETVWGMYRDLEWIRANSSREIVETMLPLMDSRQIYPVESNSIDLAITSPPYLNNYDYADRTRLELYFFGWANSWNDITKQVRDKLIIAATTQVRRNEFSDKPLSKDIEDLDLVLYKEISEKIERLSEQRLLKRGKKSYDLMVAGYFNDMLYVLKQVYQVLKPNTHFALVLGDSAPYGVFIPTEEYLGRLALAVGFREYSVQELRERGGKWKNNPIRHNVMLKEGILLVKK